MDNKYLENQLGEVLKKRKRFDTGMFYLLICVSIFMISASVAFSEFFPEFLIALVILWALFFMNKSMTNKIRKQAQKNLNK